VAALLTAWYYRDGIKDSISHKVKDVKMGIRDTIENHILVVLVSTVMGVGVVIFGVVNYFSKQKILQIETSYSIKQQDMDSIKQQDMESKLASIKRDLPDSKHFDIRRLFQTDDLQSPIAGNMHYFEEDKFYDLNSSDYWSYSKTNEIKLKQMIYGIDIDLDSKHKALAERYPFHLWRADDSIVMTKDGVKNTLFPYIFVQRLSYNVFAELLLGDLSLSCEVEDTDFDNESLVDSKNVDEFLENIAKAFVNDAAGIFFFFKQLRDFHYYFRQPKVSSKLIKLQKLGNVIYSQASTEYMDVEVNNQSTSVFVRDETIIVAAKNIFLVTIVLPSLEPTPRAPAYAHVNEWLAGVKFIVD
jgi:hypothetical protein